VNKLHRLQPGTLSSKEEALTSISTIAERIAKAEREEVEERRRLTNRAHMPVTGTGAGAGPMAVTVTMRDDWLMEGHTSRPALLTGRDSALDSSHSHSPLAQLRDAIDVERVFLKGEELAPFDADWGLDSNGRFLPSIDKINTEKKVSN
jgi:hypothetical protein